MKTKLMKTIIRNPSTPFVPRRRVARLLAGILGVFAAFILLVDDSCAAEYFVNKIGNDDQDGLSRAAAFLTVQKGVDVLSPGDTLIIGPGEYAESVHRQHLGSMEKETVIRAEIPGTAVLRGDVPVGTFRKTEGYSLVYETPFDRDVQAVTEVDTLTGLSRMPNLAELDAAPGRWLYDPAQKRLYVSASDGKPADAHVYRASVIAGDGLFLDSPKRVVLEGLAVTGFNSSGPATASPSYRTPNMGLKVVWGVLFHEAKNCVIRDCTAYFNGGGFAVNNGQNPDPALAGGGNLVEDCVAYGQFFQNSAYESSGVGIYCPNNDEIRNCHTYKNNAFGSRMYGKLVSPSKIVGSLAWSNFGNLGDFQLKVGVPGARMENSISLGGFTNITDSRNSITGKEPAEFSKDNISLLPKDGKSLDLDREFADAENLDFRLQADSQFRGSGPDGKDRGPYPYAENVFYVSTQGDDAADGLSMRQAWKTLARAAKSLRPGDTVYLEGGEYDGNLNLQADGTLEKPISLRGRGAKPVLIKGDFRVTDSSHLDFQRIRFTGAVQVGEGHDIRFDNCGFSAATCGLEATKVEGLRVTHCQFTGFGEAGLRLRPSAKRRSLVDAIRGFLPVFSKPLTGLGGTKNVFLSGNLFDNVQGPAIQLSAADEVSYSDYNAYRNLKRSWDLDGKVSPPGETDRFSREVAVQFDSDRGVPVTNNSLLLFEGGPLGKPIGLYRDVITRQVLRLTTAPKVHSVSATTANLEWMTSLPATCELAWGETPECLNKESFDVNHVGSYSLTGLKPGQTYYFRLKSLRLPDAMERTAEADAVELKSEPISFTTLAANAAPRAYYVSPQGADDHAGDSAQNAWKTLTHAAAKVNVGDTVLVASGTYPERVRIKATGEAGAPISFKALPGEKVVLNGVDKELNNAFVVTGKSFLNFDGFYFTEYNVESDQGWNPGRSGEFNLYQSRDIAITRCFSDGRGGYTAPFVSAWYVNNLLIKNCVFVNKYQVLSLTGPCPDARIENNVFAGTMVLHVVLGNRENAKASMENNIFTDNIPVKAAGNIPLFNMGDYTVNRNNCYYLRSFFSPDKRFPYEAGKGFTEYEKDGRIKDPLFANPRFAGVAVPDPKFKPSYDMGFALEDSPDRLMDPAYNLTFSDFFATNPEVVKRGIGLIQADFTVDQNDKAGTPVVATPAN